MRVGALLAAAILAYLAASMGIRAGLTAACNALFAAWGIRADNAALAPGWARLAYAWHGSAITALCAAALLALAAWLRRWFGVSCRERGSLRSGGLAALTGCAAAVLSALLFLATDSLRLEWPLGAPRLATGLPFLLAVSLLSVLAGEAFGKGLVYGLLRERWGAAWATACAVILFALANWDFAGGPVSALNVLLLGLLGCAVYERRGLAASTGMRWGWSAANLLLLGYGGGDSAVYRLYGVSEGWLTGGDAGFMRGLWATLLLAAGLAWAHRGQLRALAARLRGK